MADAIGSAARLSERASDADLAAACELERSVYVAGDEELRVAFAPATIARETSRSYGDGSGQAKYSEGTLRVGDAAPDAALWAMRSADPDASPTPARLLEAAGAAPVAGSSAGIGPSALAAKFVVLDFGSFS